MAITTAGATRYARLLAHLGRYTLTRELAFRGNFLVKVSVEVLWLGILVAFYRTVFARTQHVAGWDENQYFFFVGCFFALNGLIETFFLDNCNEFAELVRSGDLDFLLLRPIDEQFLITCRRIDWGTGPNVIMGAVVMLLSLSQMHWVFDPLRIVAFFVTFGCGTIIAYSFMLMLTSLSVWMVRNQSLMEMWWLFTSLARYPKEIFNNTWAAPLGRFFTFFLPILLVVNVPASAMVRVFDPKMIGFTIAATVVLFFVSRRFFLRRCGLTAAPAVDPAGRNMVPNTRALQAILEDCGIGLSGEQYEQLWAYHVMLRSANAELNLTRIHNFENMVLKHYVDSLLVLKFEELPSPWLDMGTGPGLPGIPLKIARPDIPVILAEPRGARVEFLNEVVERLGLRDVEVFGGKITSRIDRKVGGIITRAVASIPETLERVVNCLAPGGRMLFMKGPECDDEIAQAEASQSGLFRRVADHAYAIPGTTHDRRLVVYERLAGESASRPGAVAFATHSGPTREASSETNPTFRLCRDVLVGKGIRKHGRAILAGTRLVAEVLEKFPERAEGWLTDEQGPPPPENAPGLLWVRFADRLFKELDTSGTHAPLLLVRTPEVPAWSADAPWPGGCTLFVPFQDPENVGAVLRSAAAFGVARVVLLKEAAHPFHPKGARAAGPALFQVAMEQGPSIHDLMGGKVPLIALAMEGPDLGSEPFPATFGLVPGLEGPGLPAHLREGERRRIPIAAGVESLNAATASAVALYVWSQGRPKG